MITFELNILDWIQSNLSSAPIDTVMVGITHLGDKGLVWLALAALLLARAKTRRQGCAIVLALGLSLLVCNLTLKPFVARLRPFEFNSAVSLLIAAPRDYSFPSGHTASSFAAVGALYFTRWRYWGWAAMLAALVAFSRLYLYVHFPSDVLAGAMLGALLGGAGALLAGRAERLLASRP